MGRDGRGEARDGDVAVRFQPHFTRAVANHSTKIMSCHDMGRNSPGCGELEGLTTTYFETGPSRRVS